MYEEMGMKTMQKYLTSAWETTESDTETIVTARRGLEIKRRILCSNSGTQN
jgi:hypothetical protein